jgi:TPP-dependent pyruvate/acetoin dehydrogenase alpha subunit
MPGRFTAFGIKTWGRETADVLEVRKAAREVVRYVRSGAGPACLQLHTQRFMAHSKGDDTRSQEELDTIRKTDPLILHGVRLSKPERENAELETAALVEDAFQRAAADPFPNLKIDGEAS